MDEEKKMRDAFMVNGREKDPNQVLRMRLRPTTLNLDRVPDHLKDEMFWREEERQARLAEIEAQRERDFFGKKHWWLADRHWTPHPQDLRPGDSYGWVKVEAHTPTILR